MGCTLFSNYHFQMGVTGMGFAEDFGRKLHDLKFVHTGRTSFVPSHKSTIPPSIEQRAIRITSKASQISM